MAQSLLTPAQVKEARRLLGWSQAQAAQKAGVSQETLAHFEVGVGNPRPHTRDALRRAFEAAGIEFTESAPPSIRLKRKINAAL